MLKTVTTVSAMRELIRFFRSQGQSIGFVPTMGFLHEGHASLIQRAAAENHCVVVSVFVNPLQFGPAEDFDRYPRDPEQDRRVCEAAFLSAKGQSFADIPPAESRLVLFRPGVEELYENGFCTAVTMEGPAQGLCGASRPGHFSGVCTVVAKLFNIVAPHRAYFGQKDAQQLAVITRMVKDLNWDIAIVSCPTIRESGGVAMSSRNACLTEKERTAASCLRRALLAAEELLRRGEQDAAAVEAAMAGIIQEEPLAVPDYISVVDAENLSPVRTIEAPVLCALAVRIGNTRLIDNIIWRVNETVTA